MSDYEDYVTNYDEQSKETFIQDKDETFQEDDYQEKSTLKGTFQEEDNSEIEEIDESLGSSDLKGIRRPSQLKSMTERELIRRTASIFESAKDCKIVLQYDGKGSGNWVAKGNFKESIST